MMLERNYLPCQIKLIQLPSISILNCIVTERKKAKGQSELKIKDFIAKTLFSENFSFMSRN